MRASRANYKALPGNSISRRSLANPFQHGRVIARLSMSTASTTARGVHTKVRAIKWSVDHRTAVEWSIMWAKAHIGMSPPAARVASSFVLLCADLNLVFGKRKAQG